MFTQTTNFKWPKVGHNLQKKALKASVFISVPWPLNKALSFFRKARLDTSKGMSS